MKIFAKVRTIFDIYNIVLLIGNKKTTLYIKIFLFFLEFFLSFHDIYIILIIYSINNNKS